MKGRLWWSSVLPLAATFCLAFVATDAAMAQATVGGANQTRQRPGLIDPLCGLEGGPALSSAACDSQTGREWEGIASTDYFSYEPNVYSPPNPDIAVGPDDILTVVNRTIARYPNPNAATSANPTGRGPVTYSPANTYFFPPTSRQFLDVWLGEAALNELCPTFPRSFASCVIDNASVRYDQMQGRFLVLFTVVDTGLVNCSGCLGVPTQQTGTLRRKASWVLISSRWATGCQGAVSTAGGTGVNIGTTCTPNTNPAAPPLTGNTEFFTTPQPPGPSQSNPNSGGLNTNWVSYYGTPDGTCDATCSFGNINSISDSRRSGFTAPQGARTIDCNNTAVGDSTRVCYFPSSARLGLDNDNITISSSVYDDNVALNTRGFNAGAGQVIAWEGTRTRVHKKSGVYTGRTSSTDAACTANSSLQCPGAAQAGTPLQGDFYDLWGNSTTAYTHDKLITQSLPGGGSRTVPGLNFEPVHVRGRSLSSANGNANQAGVSYLVGAVDQPYLLTSPVGASAPQTVLYLRNINYTRTDPGPLSTNTGATTPTVAIPAIIGGIPSLGALTTTPVPQFANPNAVIQRAKLVQPSPNNQLGTPWLYVGDNRPHRAIFREGHIYDARVAALANFANFSSTAVQSTVTYDIIQKTTAAGAPLTIYNTQWGNGNFYAPMFDTPANVIQYGAVSPINVQPFLEKLFVGTTYPPLAPTDARTAAYGYTGISAAALQACTGLEPSTTTNNRAYPGLFDIRCGEDAYDTAQAYRHPVSGAFTPGDFQVGFAADFPNQIVPYGIRGGAATDPNNLGLWLYGSYAKGRLASVPGFGQWGTYVAHYPLTFPIRDPYNNRLGGYTDVQPGHPFYTFIQIAKQTEIQPGSRAEATFNVNGLVTRAEMARWTIRAQMDEPAITNYLNATGGIYCSFADVSCPGSSGTVTDTTGNQTAGDWRYIEAMYRRGYTKGCDTTNDGQRRFCPTRNLSRGEMAVFVIRAKMNSVFPTVTSGAFTTSTCSPTLGNPSQPTLVTQVGDQFGLFVGCTSYFSDVPNNHPYFAFIQKLRELRVTNGRTLPAVGATQGTYDPDGTLTRGELMTFLVRAFFP